MSPSPGAPLRPDYSRPRRGQRSQRTAAAGRGRVGHGRGCGRSGRIARSRRAALDAGLGADVGLRAAESGGRSGSERGEMRDHSLPLPYHHTTLFVHCDNYVGCTVV
jgi:hypothetical protein